MTYSLYSRIYDHLHAHKDVKDDCKVDTIIVKPTSVVLKMLQDIYYI